MWGEEEINVPVCSLRVVETAIPQHSYMGVLSEPSIVRSHLESGSSELLPSSDCSY